jgi:hypothetical protein
MSRPIKVMAEQAPTSGFGLVPSCPTVMPPYVRQELSISPTSL